MSTALKQTYEETIISQLASLADNKRDAEWATKMRAAYTEYGHLTARQIECTEEALDRYPGFAQPKATSNVLPLKTFAEAGASPTALLDQPKSEPARIAVGDKFGDLTVTSLDGAKINTMCKCGNARTFYTDILRAMKHCSKDCPLSPRKDCKPPNYWTKRRINKTLRENGFISLAAAKASMPGMYNAYGRHAKGNPTYKAAVREILEQNRATQLDLHRVPPVETPAVIQTQTKLPTRVIGNGIPWATVLSAAALAALILDLIVKVL